MKTIEYSEHGHAYSDHQAEEAARSFLLGNDEYVHVSTENFCTAVRVLIREQVIAHDQVQFLFQNEYIAPARSGGLTHWPFGFCDKTDKWLERLLG